MGNTSQSKPHVGSESAETFVKQDLLDQTIFIENSTQVVEFQPNNKNKVVFCDKDRLCTSREHVYSIQLHVEFSHDATPFIGFNVGKLDFHGIGSAIWDLRSGTLTNFGKEKADIFVPKLNSSGVVKCTFDMTRKEEVKATFEVEGKIHTKTVQLQGIAHELFPFVGVRQSGSKAVSFQLVSSEEFHDLTAAVKFGYPSGQMKVSRNGKTVFRSSTQQGNCCVLIQRKITSGIHKYKLLIKCDFGASLCLGLARAPFKLTEDYLKDDMKHIYRHPALMVWRSYRGLLYRNGRQLEKSIEPLGWQHGSNIEIEFVVDMTRKTVQIFRNGYPLGTPFQDISGPLQPIIAFYASYEKEVELTSYLTTETEDIPYVTSDSVLPIRETLIPEVVTFDPSNMQGEIKLSSDQMTLYREKDQSGNSFCYLNLVCATSGVFSFSFVVESDQGASTCIGVSKATRSQAVYISETANVYNSSDMYVYRSFQGMIYRAGYELEKKFEEFWMSGTLVEMVVEVNDDEAIVQYVVNGLDQGVAFAGVELPVYPVVAFYAGMEKKVSLIHFEHNPKARPAAPLPSITQYNSFKASHNSTKSNNTTLPILAKASDAVLYYQDCVTCGNRNDVIPLPCKHSMFCALHIQIGSKCVACDEEIKGTWNILKL